MITLIRQDPEFTTFRASYNWADRPRQRASEHFVNLPREATGLDDDECPLAEECVVSAIEHDFAVLASPNATDEEKLAALKFLGHWVGDIHQPLHAASQDDRGGNHIRMLGSSCESLHTVWDSCLVEERLGMHPLAIAEVDILDLYQKSDPLQWPSCPCRFARTSKPARCCTTSLEHGDIVGTDAVGRTIIQLAVDDRVLETLMTFDADAAELEPEPDEEEDGPPVVVELVRAKMVERRRALASARD